MPNHVVWRQKHWNVGGYNGRAQPNNAQAQINLHASAADAERGGQGGGEGGRQAGRQAGREGEHARYLAALLKCTPDGGYRSAGLETKSKTMRKLRRYRRLIQVWLQVINDQLYSGQARRRRSRSLDRNLKFSSGLMVKSHVRMNDASTVMEAHD